MIMSTKAIRIIDIAAGSGRHCGICCVCRNKLISVGFGLAAAERSADRYNGFAAPVQPMVHAAFIAPAVYTLAFVLGYRQICKCL